MIDLHAHIFFEKLLGRAGVQGPSITHSEQGPRLNTGDYSWPLRPGEPLDIDPRARLDRLEQLGLTGQVLSLSPLWLFHSTDPSISVPFLREANDLLIEWTQEDTSRLFAVAALPASDIPASIRELERAKQNGFVGGYFGLDAHRFLDESALDDLYTAFEELDMPLFLHATVPGVDGPKGDSRLERWLGNVTMGYPFEETIAVTSFILGGVLERHPKLDVLFTHGGGTFPFLKGRIFDSLVLPNAPMDKERAEDSYARLWFDTHTHSRESLDLLVAVANSERLVFGSNFGGWDTGLPSEVAGMEPLLDANARRLLRLPAAG